jgi:hypothetical protein
VPMLIYIVIVIIAVVAEQQPGMRH